MIAVFAFLFKKSRSLAYRSLVGKYDLQSWIRLLYPNIDSLRIERNCIFYSSKGEVVGAKAFKVVDVPYTWRELSIESLLRSLTHYSRMISKEDIILIALHKKSIVDKEEFIRSLKACAHNIKVERGKEGLVFDIIKKRDEMLARIREELGESFNVTFHILVYAILSNMDEARKKLESIAPFIKMRFEADIGVKMEEVEEKELLESLKILP
jgi:hypothetical protein